MKLIHSNWNACPAAFLAGWLLLPAGLQAAQMARESFDYSAGAGNLTGMDGGSGWNGAWQTVNNGSADVVTSSLAAGSGSPAGYDATSTGNSCILPNQRRVGRFLDTSTNGPFGSRGYRDGNGNIGKDGTTLYLSFMQQANGTSAYYEFEFHRGNLGDSGRIGGIGNDTGTTNVNLRAPNGNHTPIGVGDTAVNFYVVRIDFKAGNDDVYVYRNPTSATEPGAASLFAPAIADMSFNGISFGAFNNGRTVAHDELRFGQTWNDVVIPSVAIPVFVTQPRSSVTAMVGGSVGFTAVANGYPLPTYQWYKGATPLAGKTSPTLNLSNLQLSDAGLYHLVATNTQGDATTSDASLSLEAKPPGLLLYEGFDYNVGTTNMDGRNGGLGWGGAWVAVNNGGSDVLAGSLSAGSNAPNGYDAESSGNSSFIPDQQRSGRLVDTSPGGLLGSAGYIDANGNVGTDGKTLYLSFLQQPDGTSLFYEFEFHRGNLGDPGRIAGIGNDTASAVVNLRTPINGPSLVGPGSTGVNFYVVRIDFKPGSDEVRVYQNPLSATEPGTPTLLKTDAGDMSFNGLSLAAYVGRTVKHDEIRLGQSWSDVVFGTSRRDLVWVGDGTTNNWDFAAANWNDGVGATQFSNGDPVTFSDTGSDTPAVNIPGPVSTSSLVFTNGTKDYTLSGVGPIDSSGGLIKSDVGSLTLDVPGSFGAGLTMNDGSLVLNSTASFGGNLTVNAGTVTLSGNNSFSGRLIASLGTHVLSGTNSFTGLQTTNADLTISGPTSIVGTSSPVYVGEQSGADSLLTIEAGGSLSITGTLSDAWVIGRDGGNGSVIQNGGTVTYNPSNHPEAFIGASAAGGTIASYDMNGGTLEMSNARLGFAIGPVTGTLNQTAGMINVRQLELGSVLNSGTGIYNLSGGQLTVGADGITSVANYEMNLGGGTIAASANWTSSLTMSLTGSVGNVTFDTGANNVVLSGSIDGTGGMVKAGAGILVLSGYNSFSGPTTVIAGTLAGYGNSDFSELTVESGASVAPGVDNSSVFYCSSATLQSGSTLVVDIDSTLGVSDTLRAFGNINITGAGVSFASIGSGIIEAGNQLVIVEADNLLTGTFAGYPNGATLSVGANTFTLNYSATRVTLTSTTVASPYTSWALGKGLDDSPGHESDFNADPELDGVANGLEWILGGDPLAQDAASLVTATSDPVNGITLTFTRVEASIGSANLSVQWDADLVGPWTTVPVTQAGGSYANGVQVSVDELATPDAVIVNIPASNAAAGKLFSRLRATLP